MNNMIIIRGDIHTLLDTKAKEACSFSQYGEFLGMKDFGLALSEGIPQECCIVSLLSKNSVYTDICYDNKHCIVEGVSAVSLQVTIRKKLPCLSVLPYRKKEENNLTHILLVLKPNVPIEYIEEAVGRGKLNWESL